MLLSETGKATAAHPSASTHSHLGPRVRVPSPPNLPPRTFPAPAEGAQRRDFRSPRDADLRPTTAGHQSLSCCPGSTVGAQRSLLCWPRLPVSPVRRAQGASSPRQGRPGQGHRVGPSHRTPHLPCVVLDCSSHRSACTTSSSIGAGPTWSAAQAA
jgi:hypothetical protein